MAWYTSSAGTAATINFKTNTIDTCGMAATTTNTGGVPTMSLNVQTVITAWQNTVKASKSFIGWVADGTALAPIASVVHFNYNDFTGNTTGWVNTTEFAATPVNKIDVTHNYWGAATGPTSFQNLYPKGADTSGYLGAVAVGGQIVLAADTLSAQTASCAVKTRTNSPSVLLGHKGLRGAACGRHYGEVSERPKRPMGQRCARFNRRSMP
jgi:hypothetical protein